MGGSGEGYRYAGRMTELEALMWRLGGLDAMLSSAMTMVVGLERRPDPGRVARRVDRLTRVVPRLRDRVVPGRLPGVPPRWETDPCFDLGNHLRRVRATEPPDLLAIAERACARRFDPDRPPWEMVLVEGSGDAGAEGLVLRMHHSYTDGIGGVRLALELFDTGPDQGADQELPPLPVPAPPPRLGRLGDDLLFEAARTAVTARRVVPWAASALRDALVAPHGRARSAVELARSARDQARQAALPSSTLFSRRSTGQHLARVDLPVEGMRAAGRSAGATVNDVFLAGALAGVALYHAKHGLVPASVRLGVPVSTRSGATQDDLHNQVEGVLLRGPLCIADPHERIRLVHEMVRHARGQPFLGLLGDLAALGSRLPGSSATVARLVRALDVVASNVVGPPCDLYLGGAPLESMVPFGPRSGAGLNLTLLSYRGTAHVGLNMDPAATPDTSVMIDCLRAGFEEVLA